MSIELRRRGERIGVRAGLDGGLRPDDAYVVVSGGMHGPTYCRVHHLNNRHVVSFAGIAQYRSTGGVARDDEHLHSLLDQVIHHVEGVRAHLGDRARTIRSARGVPDVQQRLVREDVKDRPGDSQASDTTVEDSNRCVCHDPSLRSMHRGIPTPRGPQLSTIGSRRLR